MDRPGQRRGITAHSPADQCLNFLDLPGLPALAGSPSGGPHWREATVTGGGSATHPMKRMCPYLGPQAIEVVCQLMADHADITNAARLRRLPPRRGHGSGPGHVATVQHWLRHHTSRWSGLDRTSRPTGSPPLTDSETVPKAVLVVVVAPALSAPQESL